jgi:hypothetical protein
MVKDCIIIKISLERLNNETGRINNLIRGLAFDLGRIEGVEVKDYSQIQTKMVGDKNENTTI